MQSSLYDPENYRADLDFDGDGYLGTTDNFQFSSRFNKPLVWRV